jgi:hypothetical protein
MQNSTKFSINYSKKGSLDIDVKHLEKSFEPDRDDIENNYNPFSVSKIQNYNPIYSEFFDMNSRNYDRIALNHRYHMVDMNTVYDTETNTTKQQPVFIKFAPLLDPIRYMVGKYKLDDESIRNLPNLTLDSSVCFPKILSKHNTSYVDNFFGFLSSKLLHTHNFLHGTDYYGSQLCVQDKYKINIVDDIEYLNTSNFFMDNLGSQFTISNNETNDYSHLGSRAHKNKLHISSSNISISSSVSLDNVIAVDIEDLEEDNAENSNNNLIYENVKRNSESNTNSTSSSSSDNSETNYSTDTGSDNDSGSETEYETVSSSDSHSSSSSSSSEYSEESNVFAYINNFPTQMICLEKCDGTLDDLFLKHSMDIDVGASMLFQIVMTLITYQKCFHFTHNDLHTNNIMYINTDIEFIYYTYDGKSYKVPTYGKIFKIIDFGRSIYRFQGKILCSDSFETGGDAATQYNFEPFMNHNKPRLEPNYSFDLCRLGTSIYDFIIDDDEVDVHDSSTLDDFQSTILRWCIDDNGKNILYKKNGEERYPNFKLYKMIARTVHNHTPQKQLEFELFNQFLCKSGIEDAVSQYCINIDSLPIYV